MYREGLNNHYQYDYYKGNERMNVERNIELIVATKEDAKEIRDLLCIVYEDELNRWFRDNEDELYIPGYTSVEMQEYHTWDNKYYKIMNDSKIIGVLLVSTTGREHGRIDRLYILPDHQGNGTGSKVLALLEALYPEVNLWTLDTTQFSKRNHHFYEKNGYQLDSQNNSERYYYKNIGKIDYDKGSYHVNQDYSFHNFRDSNFASADWFDLNMSKNTFSNCNFNQTLIQNSNLTGCRFTNVNLSNAILSDFRMENAQICHGTLSNLHIHDVNLDNKKDTSVTIERSVLENSVIRQCNLKNIKIESCDLDGATIDGISVNELLECYKKNKMI